MKEIKHKLEAIQHDIEWIDKEALRKIEDSVSILEDLNGYRSLKYIRSADDLKELLRKHGQYRGTNLDYILNGIGKSKSDLYFTKQLLERTRDALEKEKGSVK